MVIVSFEPKIPESYNAFCSASESNKQSPRRRTLDLSLIFLKRHITSIKQPITGFWLITVIYLLKKLTCINMKDYQ